MRFLGSFRAIRLSISISVYPVYFLNVLYFIDFESDSDSDVHISSLLLYDFILLSPILFTFITFIRYFGNSGNLYFCS